MCVSGGALNAKFEYVPAGAPAGTHATMPTPGKPVVAQPTFHSDQLSRFQVYVQPSIGTSVPLGKLHECTVYVSARAEPPKLKAASTISARTTQHVPLRMRTLISRCAPSPGVNPLSRTDSRAVHAPSPETDMS